jgi:peptidoglycan hydrolase-like protein with peptidoglycan-binding domain
MRTLILATASAIALGIASPIYAADNTAGNPAPAAPAATQTPATGPMQTAAPQAGPQMQQTAPSMSGNNQPNNGDTASTSQSSLDWPRVTSSDVQQIQQKLQHDGLYHGKIDGLVGPGTQQALRVYQRNNALPVTATLDPQTMNSLLAAGVGVGSSTPPNSSNNTNMAPPSNAGTNAGSNQPTTNHQ